MNQNTKLIIGLIILVSFFYTVLHLSDYLTPKNDVPIIQPCTIGEGCPHENQLNALYALIPLLVSISLLVGAGVFFLMSQKVESKQKSLKENINILMQFLNQDEKKFLDKLIESKGKVIQAEITRLPGMTKVKSHRVIQKLLDKGVIEKESLGKTNVIKFTENIKNALIE